MTQPTYFSESMTIGPHTYLLEVKLSKRGQKYFIITQTSLRDEEQRPVVVFGNYMQRFAEAIEKARKAVKTNVAELEPDPHRKHYYVHDIEPKRSPVRERKTTARKTVRPTPGTKKKNSASRKVRPNQGKRWTEEHDSVLIVQFKNGMSIAELALLLGRGEFSIQVRLAKLGLTKSKT